MLDIRPPVARRSAPDATWRARLLRGDRYVALAEVSAPADREVGPDWEPTWGAVADAECEAILARVTALLRDKLLHATPQT